MDEQQKIFLGFIVIAVALAIYGIVIGSWLTKKSLKLENEAKVGGYKGLISLAMWPISCIALLLLPIWVACQGYRFHIGTNRMNIVLMISLIPSCTFYCIYNVYYRLKAGKK